jgi:hypothetical protein
MHKTNIRINKEAIIIIYHHGINFVTLPKVEGPIRRTRGGSERGPIKILLEGDEVSNKTNTGSAHVSDSLPKLAKST